MNPNTFIDTIAPAAQACLNIPPSVTIAQAAIESAWGSSQLTEQANNLFGIKAGAYWHGSFITMPTHEYVGSQLITVQAAFRKYPNWQASIQDHAEFLQQNERYGPCFAAINPVGFVQSLQSCGYSTNPHYAALLTSIINFHDLTRFDHGGPYETAA